MRSWRFCTQFDDGTTHLSFVTLSDMVAFIKESTTKNKGVKKYTTLSIDSWLVDIVFDKAMEYSPIVKVMDITISRRG